MAFPAKTGISWAYSTDRNLKMAFGAKLLHDSAFQVSNRERRAEVESPDRITRENLPHRRRHAYAGGRPAAAMLKPEIAWPPMERPGPATWPLSHVTPLIRALTGSPAMARSHVRAVLADWEMTGLSDNAELVASELVTNVVLAAGPQEQDEDPGTLARLFQVGMFSDRTALLIEVFDTVPGQPERRDAATGDENGRGLAIVEALSETWGTRPHPRGKVVYARLRTA